MKQRLGGLLAITLGAVLITTGISNSDAGGVGGVSPTCGAAVLGVAVICPTGVLNIAEITTPTPVAGDPTPPPGGWTVTITSTCLDPATALPVNQVVHVPNNGNVDSDPVFVYTNESSSTKCEYTYTETAVAGFTIAYTPASPFTIPFSGSPANSGQKLSITNSFVHTPPSSSVPATSPAPSSSGGNLANTGPHAKIGTSLYFGIALVLLGAVMLFGGRRRRTGSRV